jgi:DNA polymerase-4
VDVRAIDAADLQAAVGSLAAWLQQLACGTDDRPVVPHRASKSSGSENTYAQDLTDLDAMRREIAGMAEQAAAWLSRHTLTARTVTIKVRYSDFTTVTRSQTGPPTCDGATLAARAVPLLDRTDAGRRAVRLLGVSVHNLCAVHDSPNDPERLPFDERSA